MQQDGVEFHNVAELRTIDGHDGQRLQRVPESVRTELNEGAQWRMCHPASVEIRFVPDTSVELSLSMHPQGGVTEETVHVFWGPFQSRETFEIVESETTIELTPPEEVEDIRPEALDSLAFDPRVCRVRLPGEHRGGHVFYHGIDGSVRPPREDELPETRYLAYGTSITEGESPVAEHLSYVNQTAWRLGADPINLGSCGTAYCDKAMAEYIAQRDDWDIATLALSVNMVGTFSVEQFRERAMSMIDTIAERHDEPIAVITIYRNARDVRISDESEQEQFREVLREIVAERDDTVSLLEGPEILPDLAGLSTDLVHPGDNAMIRMGENLATELERLL